ncbi:MAG: hypothetical protein LJE68_12660, partial [Rhodobacter sp.]|nr:hypothetical protein [Rhodobacter sp.]
MIQAEPIGWWNTGFPLTLLGAMAVLLPHGLVQGLGGRRTRSHALVAMAVLVSGLLLLALGAGLFALIYGARGAEVSAAFDAAPALTAWFFLRLSGFTALLWVPLLAL